MRTSFNFQPQLTDSMFRFRLELAKKRLRSYPVDTLDFAMIDLERPAHRTRHAHQCTTDLTGRTIEFMAEVQTILPGEDDTYLQDLFRRIVLKGGDQYGYARRFFPYFRYTNDPVAYEAIRSIMDGWVKEYQKDPAAFAVRSECDCYIEGLALMYDYTGVAEYADVARAMVPLCLNRYLNKDGEIGFNAHMHGLMTVMRAILLLAKVTHDEKLVELIDHHRRTIKESEYADGMVAESFPKSERTEGCAISDWIMLNLRWYDVTGDTEALDDAERTYLNALFFNQFITGGFGHRSMRANGYGTTIEEAWWCCTQTAGMGMCEFAKSAVQLCDGKIEIVFPIPGVYTLTYHDKPLTVTLTSAYPATYAMTVRVTGDTSVPVTFRTPYYVRNMKITEHDMATISQTRVFTVSADIGHYVEKREDGYVLKYGPLVLAPMIYSYGGIPMGKAEQTDPNIVTVPEGYARDELGDGLLAIKEPDDAKIDENGFWRVGVGDNLPEWAVFDDGPTSRTGMNNRATAKVTLINENGAEKEYFFHPLCYATCNLSIYDTPVAFGLVSKKRTN